MDTNLKYFQIWVSLIKDIVTGLAAVVAAVIAIMGLRTWKKQLKGKTEYELSQRFLRATYKVRDAFSWVRNPIQSPSEISQAMIEANIEGNPIKDQRFIFRVRERFIINAGKK